jgi:hypothetical protein
MIKAQLFGTTFLLFFIFKNNKISEAIISYVVLFLFGIKKKKKKKKGSSLVSVGQ